MSDAPLAEGRLAQIALVLLLLITWFCYQPAFDGAFQLDDRSNLGELSRVDDFNSGVNFALSGSAGPVGRPIALASFAMQADAWQEGARDFLQINIFIHLINGALLAFCLFRLALLSGWQRDRAWTIGVLAAGIWMLLPLLATASLLVVQRMTTLSALFMLLGLAGYLQARSRIDRNARHALLWMTVSLIAGTLLAVLCKESGLLLPVFVLVLELTILQPPRHVASRSWRIWQAVILGSPLLFILVYLASVVPYPEALTLSRGYSGGERLMTEAGILWVYLYKALVGLPSSLGVFQDPPAVATDFWHWPTLLACLSWLALAAAAIVWRRRWPLFALAVLWFLAGHLIESTVIALELYFEHRNYLALVGPLFALSAFLMSLSGRARLTAIGVCTGFAVLNAYLLFVFASLWGEPSMASRYWAVRYPESVRAVTTMATYQLSEEGPVRTIETLGAFVERNPQHAYLRIQQLNLLCRIAPSADNRQLVELTQRQLRDVKFTYTAGTMLSQLFDAAIATDCASVGSKELVSLADSLRQNPRYTNEPHYNQFHEKLMAGIARRAGDHEAALVHLRAAIGFRPAAELNFMMVTTLVDLGQFAAARTFMEDARQAAPRNPLRAAKWHRDLDELLVYVNEVEKVRQ